ncbi:alpha/beta fold hydrolase [Algicella marina]
MRFSTSDGLKLYYEDEGSGLPVLCLPGLTRNARDFDDVAPHLDGCRVIRLVSRGRDRSDFDPDPSNYTVTIEARDVVELLDHLQLERVVVLGTSRGGLIAMTLAATAKKRLAGVVLNDIGPRIEPDGLQKIIDYIGVPPKGRDFTEVGAALNAAMGDDFPGISDLRWTMLAERWFEETRDGIALKYDPKLAEVVKEGSSAPAPDLWPLFDMLEGIPLGVIRGENSNLLSASILEEMQLRRPDMASATVPDRGHVPFLDEDESLGVIKKVIEMVDR